MATKEGSCKQQCCVQEPHHFGVALEGAAFVDREEENDRISTLRDGERRFAHGEAQEQRRALPSVGGGLNCTWEQGLVERAQLYIERFVELALIALLRRPYSLLHGNFQVPCTEALHDKKACVL